MSDQTNLPPASACKRCGAVLASLGGDALCPSCMLREALGAGGPPAGTPGAGAIPPKVAAGSRVIGPYKLLEQIGEGGMGTVWMAEQTQPIRRRVALKIIRPGMDSGSILARFEAERQALALMDHPNIARVLDAGSTPEGRPYFVMELVMGIPLIRFCDEQRLTIRGRLELFLPVCQAIQHAHQKGVIHRDIKPGNVLVALYDGRPVPKVIDFGIAKAAGQQLTERTLFTEFGALIGTPEYMSPEQAELNQLDIDTRSDIYSLGVLLYELLTGTTPLNRETLRQAAFDEILRRVREEEPPKPSTRLTARKDRLASISAQRQIAPAHLTRLMRGDLDWIVMKALEKDRNRRYETANGLAMDLQRHLHDETVQARPPSAGYRFQKTFRRNKGVFAAAAALLLTVAIGLIGVIWQWRNAVSAQRGEEKHRLLAETNAFKAGQLAKSETEHRVRAEDLAEQNRLGLYAATIKVIEQTLAGGDAGSAIDLLDRLRPGPGESDLRGFEWYYLWQQLRGERFVVTHSNKVHACAYSPDGLWLATAGDRAVVRVGSATNGVESRRLTGNKGTVGALAFSPDGTMLAAADSRGSVCIWDTRTWDVLRVLLGEGQSFHALAFSRDGTRLAAGEAKLGNGDGNPFTAYAPSTNSGVVYVWDPQDGRRLWSAVSQTNGVRCLAFSPDGKALASGGLENSVKLHDAATGRIIAVQSRFPEPVFSLAFLPEQQGLAVASWFPYTESGRIRILDATTLELRHVLVERAGKVLALALSPDGTRLAAGGADRVARVWETATGTALGAHVNRSSISSLAFSPDGGALAVGAWDDSTRVWDMDGGVTRQHIPTRNPFSVAFSPDGTLLACGGITVDVREAATGRLLRELPDGEFGGDVRIAFSPDGSILAGVDYSGRICFWDTRTWRSWRPAAGDKEVYQPGIAGFVPDTQFAFSPDSQRFVMGGTDKIIRFWDARSGRLTGVVSNSQIVFSVAFTPDGRTLIGGYGGRIRFWNVASHEVITSMRDDGAFLRVSKDGRWLASGGGFAPQTIKIRELPSMKERAAIRGHNALVYGIAFSGDSRTLATASWDGSVKLWHVATGQELMTVPSRVGVVWGAAFAPGDRMLAFACNTTVKEGGQVIVLRAADASKADAPDRLTRQLESRAENLARAGRWSESAALLNQARSLALTNYLYYHKLAPLLVAANRREDYYALASEIQTRFSQTRNPQVAERMAKACLILPNAALDWPVITQLVFKAESLRKQDSRAPYVVMLAGLAAHRQGRHAEALEEMSQVVTMKSQDANPEVTGWLVQALAHHELRHTNEARAALARGLELGRTKLPKAEFGALGGYWNDWVITRALTIEARSMVEGMKPEGALAFQLDHVEGGATNLLAPSPFRPVVIPTKPPTAN